MSALRTIFAATALSAAVLGAGAAEAAVTFDKTCGGSLCLHKRTARNWDGSLTYYLTFRGSTVSHYNIRFHEAGGREVQIEVPTVSGSNQSKIRYFNAAPGGRYTIRVQACNRTSFGPFSSKSSCGTWYTVNFTVPQAKD